MQLSLHVTQHTRISNSKVNQAPESGKEVWIYDIKLVDILLCNSLLTPLCVSLHGTISKFVYDKQNMYDPKFVGGVKIIHSWL